MKWLGVFNRYDTFRIIDFYNNGIPEYIRGSLICYRNTLKSLEGFNDDDFNYLHCDNKDRLVLKHKRSKKLKLINYDRTRNT